METVTLSMTLPSLNEFIDSERANRFKGAAMKKQCQADIKIFLHNAIVRGTLHRHEKPCTLEIHWVEPNNRRDCDNISFGLKFIQDALVEIGVLPDDSRKYITGITHTFTTDKTNPHIEVTIREKEK